MEPILNWGIEVVLWFQKFSPALDTPFKVLTFLGDKEFYLLLMPMVYWCIHRRVGTGLFVLLLVSALLNESIKLLLDQPRPFNYDPRVIKLVHEDSGGLPSGHTQSAVVVWGYLVYRFKRLHLWMLAGFLVLAIPLSRIYLGAHFPTDLVGGYAIGAVVLFLFLRLDDPIGNWLAKKGIGLQLAVSMGLPVMLLLSILILSEWTLCMLGNHYFNPKGSFLLAMPVYGVSLVTSLLICRIFAMPLKKVYEMFNKDYNAPKKVIGRICIVATTSVSDKMGQAEVKTKGAPIVLNVISDGEHVFHKGDEAVIVGRDSEKGIYTIAPLDLEK